MVFPLQSPQIDKPQRGGWVALSRGENAGQADGPAGARCAGMGPEFRHRGAPALGCMRARPVDAPTAILPRAGYFELLIIILIYHRKYKNVSVNRATENCCEVSNRLFRRTFIRGVVWCGFCRHGCRELWRARRAMRIYWISWRAFSGRAGL